MKLIRGWDIGLFCARTFPLFRLCFLVGLGLTLSQSAFAQGHSDPNKPGTAPQEKSAKHVPGVVLLKLNAGKKLHELKDLTASYGLQLDEDALIPELGVYRARIPPGLLKKGDEEKAYAGALKADPRNVLDFASEDRILNPVLTPNDPQYASQWHLPKINAAAAWDTTTGSNTITIAILDTGINPHPDFASKLVPGWNVYNNSSNTSDVYGHGTMVAGIAAAVGNNAIGIAGVAWGTKIMPVRISNSLGQSYSSTIAQGLVWAANNNARVANISFSQLANDPIIDAGAYYFQMRNGLVVAAAGVNWALSAADDPYLLSVNATDQNDQLATFCFPGTYADLAAPGVDIVSTDWNGGYTSGSGISFSTAIVSGLAALVMSANGTLSPARVAQTIKQTALDLGPVGYDLEFGAGRVNAQAAVALALSGGAPPSTDTTPPTVQINSPTASQSVSGTILVRVTASDNVGLSSVNLSVDGTLKAVNSITPFDSIVWDSKTVPNGQHILRVDAVDKSFNTAGVQVTVHVNNPSDTQAPQLNFSCPRNSSATLSGIREIVVSGIDDTAMGNITFSVDGGPATVGAEEGITRGKTFVFSWDTRTVTNAVHTLTARGLDIWGNTAVLSVPVTVRNSGPDVTAPFAPGIISPAFESTTDPTPTFTWGAVTDPTGVSYRLLVFNAADIHFDTPIADVTTTNTTHTLATALPLGDYYWTVNAIDGATNIEACGNIGVISIIEQDTNAPAIPVLSSPANGSALPNIVHWFWSNVGDTSSVSYELQVDNSGAAFPSPEINISSLTSGSYSSYIALPPGIYSWRVRSKDGASPPNLSNWSSVWNFTVLASSDTTAPVTPTLSLPANASSTTDTTPAFDWTDVSDASGVGFQIQIDDSGPSFPSPEIDFIGYIGSAFTPTYGLEPNTHSWRVRTFDGVGLTSAWSPAWSITILADTVPPTVPILLSPASNTSSTNPTPVFDWTDSTDLNTLTYEILVTDSINNQYYYIHEWNLPASQYISSNLYPHLHDHLSPGTYAWRVRAFDGDNYSAWSPPRLLTIVPDPNNPAVSPPSVPVPLAPANGASITSHIPTFDWSDVSNPSGWTLLYWIEIDDNNDFSSPIVNPINGAPGFATETSSFGQARLSNGTYYWRVRAYTQVAGSSFGPVWSFTVTSPGDSTPPPIPILSLPANGATLNGAQGVVFDWGEVSDMSGVRYQIQIDNSGSTFPSPERTVTTMRSFDAVALGLGSYHWRIRAIDGVDNYGTWSNPWSFVIVTAASAPNLLSPADVATSNGTPSFDWTDVSYPGGATYKFQIDNSGGFFLSPEISVSNLTASSYTPSIVLPGGTYSWRVMATDGAGNAGSWSATWIVNIEPAPSPGSGPAISASSPPSGYIDPLEDKDATSGALLGLQNISITFSKPVTAFGGGALSISNFLVRSIKDGTQVLDLETQRLPTLTLLSGSGAGPYVIRFEPRIALGAWTEIEAVDVVDSGGVLISPAGNRIVLGALPMDITQDGRVLGDDISRWLAINNNVFNVAPLTKLNFCDQKRNGVIAGEDIARAQQLINGIATFQTWSGFDLGTRP